MQASKHRMVIRQRLAAGEAPGAIASSLGIAKSTVYRARNSQGRRKGEAAAYGVVSARISEREAGALERLSRESGASSKGKVLRDLVRNAGGFYSARPDEEAFLAGADQHLSRLGGNFNQIAAALSASVRKIGRADPTQDQIEMMQAAADEIEEIRAVLRQMLDNSQHRAAALREALKNEGAEELNDG